MELQDLIIKIEDTERQIEFLKIQRTNLLSDLQAKIAPDVSDQLSTKEYGCGTATIDAGDFKVKAVVSKKVTWDQEKLAQIRADILSHGDDPDKYMKMELKVSETSYKSWKDDIKLAFEPARTVTPSEPKISFERKTS